MLKFRRMMGHLRDDDRGGGGGSGAEYNEWKEAERERKRKEEERRRNQAEADRLGGIARGDKATVQDQLNYLEALRKLNPSKYTTTDVSSNAGGGGNAGGSANHQTVKNWGHDSWERLGVNQEVYKRWYDATFTHSGLFSSIGDLFGNIGDALGGLGGFVVDIGKPVLDAGLGMIEDTVNAGLDAGKGVIGGVGDILEGDILGGLEEIGKGVTGGAGDFIGGVIGNIFEGVGGGFQAGLESLLPMPEIPEIPQYDPLKPEQATSKLISNEPKKLDQFGEGEIDPITGQRLGVTDQRGKLAENLK